jgi:hypothetical protein
MTSNNAVALIPTTHEMQVYETMAKQAHESKLYCGMGDMYKLKMIMLKARELNVAPMTAIDGGIHIINGKTEIAARLMGAMIFRAGHSISIEKEDGEQCILKGMRSNGTIQTASFSIEEAKQAGLIKPNSGWTKYPKDMLYARALSRLARRLFPDVIGTGYVEGEIHDKDVQPVAVQNASEISILQDEQTIEEALEKEDEILKNFLSQFDRDEAKNWGEYVSQIKNKLNLSISKIVEKYNEDPAKATEKFQLWIGKRT